MTGSPFAPPPQQAGGTQRCRQCGARLAREVEWCSLCLTPTAEPALPVQREVAATGIKDEVAGEPGDAGGHLAEDVGEHPHKGRHVREGVGEPSPAELLAELAAREADSGGRSALTVARAHLALAEVPGGKYALAFGGGLLLLILLMGGLTLLGMLV